MDKLLGFQLTPIYIESVKELVSHQIAKHQRKQKKLKKYKKRLLRDYDLNIYFL